MTLTEAIAAAKPAWVTWWLNWLLIGAFLLPAVLLIWKESRVAGGITLVASVIAAFAVGAMYAQMGYVRLLGLPHIMLWTPVVIYLWRQVRRADMRDWPRRIMWVVIATLVISLAFDYADAARYLFGERTPLVVRV